MKYCISFYIETKKNFDQNEKERESKTVVIREGI